MHSVCSIHPHVKCVVIVFFHISTSPRGKKSNLNVDICFSGREKPDLDNKLLADANLDGSSSEMEQVRVWRNTRDKDTIYPGLATRCYPL